MSASGLTGLTEAERQQAMRRFEVLRPHLDEGVPLTRTAAEAGVPVRTVQRWLQRYRAWGLIGLTRTSRQPTGRRTVPELVRLIEGMALRKPRPSLASITRRAAQAAAEQGWTPVSYSTVRTIVTDLDPAMLSLAHDGADVFRDTYELVYRRRAEHPNAMWQVDHTQLDIHVLDADKVKRPWLTVALDDHSRAVPGYTVSLGAPSAMNTSLALRQAIWTKPDPTWPMCGIPEILYVDHGSDFTSDHLTQVAADLKFQIVHSTIARPQGRGKVERFFGSINTELLTELPGHLVGGRPVTAPSLSLRQLDEAIGRFVTTVYHHRDHPELGLSPHRAWVAQGWLPRMPDSLEYSRNLIFADGHRMQQIFDAVVDRTRSRLDVPKVRTVFGAAQRPRRTRKHSSVIEAAIETPTFDLTVFKLHFGRLTGKAYTKGERVLRFEAIAHNTAELRCGRMIEKFPEIVSQLGGIADRFATALDCVDTGFIDDGLLNELPTGTQLGATRIGGVDLNKPRMHDALRAALALAAAPHGFTVAEFAAKVYALTGHDHTGYSVRQAAYDLRKLRGKQLIDKPARTRRYIVAPMAARTIAALLTLRDQVIAPILAGVHSPRMGRKPAHWTPVDRDYERIRIDMQTLFNDLAIETPLAA